MKRAELVAAYKAWEGERHGREMRPAEWVGYLLHLWGEKSRVLVCTDIAMHKEAHKLLLEMEE